MLDLPDLKKKKEKKAKYKLLWLSLTNKWSFKKDFKNLSSCDFSKLGKKFKIHSHLAIYKKNQRHIYFTLVFTVFFQFPLFQKLTFNNIVIHYSLAIQKD